MKISIVMLMGLAGCAAEEDPYAPVDCTKKMEGVETFVADLEHPGDKGVFDFTLKSAEPAPPARHYNTWVMQLSTLGAGAVGTPVDGATIYVTPYMPKHGHVSAVPVEIMPMTEPGTYQLASLKLGMNGVWETTVRATLDASTDSTVFTFCIP